MCLARPSVGLRIKVLLEYSLGNIPLTLTKLHVRLVILSLGKQRLEPALHILHLLDCHLVLIPLQHGKLLAHTLKIGLEHFDWKLRPFCLNFYNSLAMHFLEHIADTHLPKPLLAQSDSS